MTPSAEPAGECEACASARNYPNPILRNIDILVARETKTVPALEAINTIAAVRDAHHAALARLKERAEKLEGTLKGLIAHHHDDEWEAECYSFELEARRALEAGK